MLFFELHLSELRLIVAVSLLLFVFLSNSDTLHWSRAIVAYWIANLFVKWRNCDLNFDCFRLDLRLIRRQIGFLLFCLVNLSKSCFLLNHWLFWNFLVSSKFSMSQFHWWALRVFCFSQFIHSISFHCSILAGRHQWLFFLSGSIDLSLAMSIRDFVLPQFLSVHDFSFVPEICYLSHFVRVHVILAAWRRWRTIGHSC
jgi:hypothetical protein